MRRRSLQPGTPATAFLRPGLAGGRRVRETAADSAGSARGWPPRPRPPARSATARGTTRGVRAARRASGRTVAPSAAAVFGVGAKRGGGRSSTSSGRAGLPVRGCALAKLQSAPGPQPGSRPRFPGTRADRLASSTAVYSLATRPASACLKATLNAYYQDNGYHRNVTLKMAGRSSSGRPFRLRASPCGASLTELSPRTIIALLGRIHARPSCRSACRRP